MESGVVGLRMLGAEELAKRERPTQGVHFAATVPPKINTLKSLPTAMQKSRLGQETPTEAASSRCRGTGPTRAASAPRRSARRSRSHRSHQNRRPRRDTPAGPEQLTSKRSANGCPPGAGFGVGMGMIDQREPIRRSASALMSRTRRTAPRWPRSTRRRSTRGPFGQETPLNCAPRAPLGSGADCRAQALIRPNQRSTSGTGLVRPFEAPAAVQVRFRGQETSEGPPGRETGASGMDWTCQPVAPHRSASVPVAWGDPVAVQARSPEQEMARGRRGQNGRARLV